jgi:hypothetical protein
MTPEEYEGAQRILVRFGHLFDVNVGVRLHLGDRLKPYYQAQCSFCGLRTAGTKIELQQSLLYRNPSEDFATQQDLHERQLEVSAYEDEQEAIRVEEEAIRFEQWWQDPTTDFVEKLDELPQRALEEEMQTPESFLLQSKLMSKWP